MWVACGVYHTIKKIGTFSMTEMREEHSDTSISVVVAGVVLSVLLGLMVNILIGPFCFLYKHTPDE
jgi:ABC-type nitrate/sulfonate/bicarbonate transport system permease component